MAKMRASGVAGLLTSTRRVGTGEKGHFINCVNLLAYEGGVLVPREGRSAIDTVDSGFNINRSYFSTVFGRVLRASATSNRLQGTDAAGNLFSVNLDTTRRYGAMSDARKFCYLLSNEGLRKINIGFTATEIGGVPEALDGQLFATATTAGAWFPNNTQAAYRYVLARKQTNQEFFYGAPSGRIVVVNSSGNTIFPTLRFTIPTEVDTTYFYQVYRTQTSAGVTTDPGDEMFLVFENTITATDVTNKYVEFSDFVPDGNGGAALYTNASQNGIAQANYQCEAALSTVNSGELASFDNVLWASSYIPRASLELSMLSVNTTTGVNFLSRTGTFAIGNFTINAVSSTASVSIGMRVNSGLVPAGTTVTAVGVGTITMSAAATGAGVGSAFTLSDIITIAGTQYFSASVENIANREFFVSTDPSPARAIRETCESLVRVINRNTVNTAVYAQYLSGTNELPGRMLLFARTVRNNSLTAQSTSAGDAFAPNITVAQNLISQPDQSVLMYSRPDEPYAFPKLNFLRMPENAEIAALSALRTGLLVWTDRGLYIVSGLYGNYSLELLDSSVRTYPSTVSDAPQTAIVNNVAYCYTTKGIVSATENGAQAISIPVQNMMVQRTFGVCFGDEARNIVYVPVDNTTLAYHADFSVWTSVDTSFRHGTHDPQRQRMYFHTLNRSFYSSLPFSQNNYSDGLDVVTAISIDAVTNTLTLSAPVPATITVGDLLLMGGGVFSVITAVAGSTITVRSVVGAITGATINIRCIPCTVTYCPMGDPDPATTKHVRYVNIMFDGAGLSPTGAGTSGTPIFLNNPYERRMSFGVISDVYGTFTPQIDYFTQPILPNLNRFYLSQDAQRGSIFTPSIDLKTFNQFRLIGLEFDYEPVGDKTRR